MHEAEEEWVKETLVEAERKRCISRVVKVHSEDAVSKGNNYISDILRISLKVVLHSGDVEERSVIYKILPKNEDPRFGGVRELGVFTREAKMYTEVLPAMERLILEKEPFGEPLWPRLFGVKGNNEGLLMEDICAFGYEVEDRTKGFDLDFICLALKSIARFHALAAVLVERGEILPSDFQKMLLMQDKKKVHEMYINFAKSYKKLIEEDWKGEWLELLDGLLEVLKISEEQSAVAENLDETKFNTLTHSDFWLNNILFKKDSSGQPLHAKMIDFQLCCYNNSCLDVHYLLASSLRPESFDKIPDLLKVYYESLAKDLQLFEYKEQIPTFESIQESFDKLNYFGLTCGLGFRPIMTGLPLESVLKEHPEVDPAMYVYSCVAYGGDYVTKSTKSIIKYYRDLGYIK